MSAPFPFDRTWELEAPRADVWNLMLQTHEYQTWWPWLERCDLQALAPGEGGTCVIRSPLRYSLTFAIHVETVDRERAMTARITGDLEGPAALELADATPGTSTLRMHFALELHQPLLRPLSIFARPFARPAMAWAHDRLSEAAVTDFRKALAQAPR
jgi:polyketide cyclase/dehydrase/lipid transport protein